MAIHQQQIRLDPREFAPPPHYVADWPNSIEGTIQADEIEIGVGVVIEAGTQIRAKKVTIGDHVYIGRLSRIICPEFSIGDYSRINEGSFCGGTKPLSIGRNCYFGRGVQLDSRGGLTIGDNVGVGSLSQIWSHIRHGDCVQGNRWDKEYPVVIENDVWLVARCTIGGCQYIGARSMVLNESNVTKDILPDRLYRGNPAVDMTEKYGRQFEAIDDQEKLRRLQVDIAGFEALYPECGGRLIATCCASEFGHDKGITYFAVKERVYTKKYTRAEVEFLKWTTAKFTPMGE